MKTNRLLLLFSLCVAALAHNMVVVTPVWGQKTPPPPGNPQAPTINALPTGVQRGVPIDLLITGTNLADATGISPGIPAKVTIEADEKTRKEPTKFKARIEISADTPVGWYPFRVATLKGVSNLRVLCVDDLPQLVSAGSNRSKATAQAITIPATINGSVIAEQGDVFKFTVKAGQRLSFDCLARRLGSAMDACMYIYDAKGVRELAYDNDSPGCQTDPRISYTFKDAGEYLLEVKDVLNRGGPEFFYRIRVGDFPLATTPMPMAAKRGTKAKIGFAGPAVEGVTPVEVDVPSDPAVNVIWVAPKSAAGLHGWPVPLTPSDHDEAVEQEPNDDAKNANRIAVPGGISGRFHRSDDIDFFVFTAKKGQKLAIEAHTLEAYSPTLVYMVLRNAKTNAEIAKSNPQLPPPSDQRIDFMAADDGDFILEVQHLHFAGGPSESYRITIRPPTPSYELVLPNERFDVAPGGAAAIPVQVLRKGYTGSIEISATGHPGFTGKATIKAGANAGILLVMANSDVPMGAYQFNIVGKASNDGKPVVRSASARTAIVQALNGLPYPPMHLQTFVAWAVKEKAPFSLSIKMDPPESVPGGKAIVTITATRDEGFDDEITLTPPTGLPPNAPVPKAIPPIGKGKTETSFTLDLNAKTPMGEYFVLVSAKTKHMGKELTGTAPPLMLVLGAPFDLKVDPLPAEREKGGISLKPGDKVKLKVTAVRKGGYKGPIALDIRKLPPMVTVVGKAMIAADQTTTEIEIAAAPTAPPAEITGVDVLGTATALNNLQNASPAFTVRVQKK
jgi:Bacterial pre-peptidase C-terminal domain